MAFPGLKFHCNKEKIEPLSHIISIWTTGVSERETQLSGFFDFTLLKVCKLFPAFYHQHSKYPDLSWRLDRLEFIQRLTWTYANAAVWRSVALHTRWGHHRPNINVKIDGNHSRKVSQKGLPLPPRNLQITMVWISKKIQWAWGRPENFLKDYTI